MAIARISSDFRAHLHKMLNGGFDSSLHPSYPRADFSLIRQLHDDSAFWERTSILPCLVSGIIGLFDRRVHSTVEPPDFRSLRLSRGEGAV